MYTVVGVADSRAFRVLWALEEIGLPYDHRPEKPRSMAVRALSPAGKIPVLLAEGSTLTDSTAIIQYLADRHGALTFPAGSLDRARQDAWTHAILEEIEGPLWTAARHSFVLPQELRVPAIKESLRWEYVHSLERLSRDLPVAEGWLMGETFTVPDIVLAHCLRWAAAAKFPAPPPVFNGYLIRIGHRPAFQRALALQKTHR
jgi:glutathione S-transferase